MSELEIIKEIDLDFLIKKAVFVEAKQGDRKSRYILVSCYSNGSFVNLIPEKHTAFVRYRKRDECISFNKCQITEDGKILVELTQQMLAFPGNCTADLLVMKITKENEDNCESSTMQFYVNVVAMPYDDSNIESTDEFNALSDLMDKALKDYTYVMEHAQESADKAETEATKATDAAARAKESQTAASNSATASANSASDSAKSATASAESAGEALASQNAAKASETAAANSQKETKTSETNAKTSETASKNFAQIASDSADSAAASAETATTQATSASNSARSASTYAANAKTSETNASNSATAASTSEKNAKHPKRTPIPVPQMQKNQKKMLRLVHQLLQQKRVMPLKVRLMRRVARKPRQVKPPLRLILHPPLPRRLIMPRQVRQMRLIQLN